MKGIKTLSLANGSSERFQVDYLASTNCVITETLLVKGTDVVKMIKELKKENDELRTALKELSDKVNSFEVE